MNAKSGFSALAFALFLTACGSGSNDSSQPTPQALDTTPDPFSFTQQQDVEIDTVVVSQPLRITGIDGAATVTIENGQYAINGGDFSSSPGTVNNGDEIIVQHTSSPTYETQVTTTLTVGGVTATFVSVTLLEPDEAAPVVQLLYPWQQSWSTDSEVVVRGTATDSSEVSNIIVNGIAAEFLPSASGKASLAKSLAANQTSGTVNWQVTLPLNSEDTDHDISVVASDSEGNVNSSAAQAQVSTFAAPWTLDIDVEGQRIVGRNDNRYLIFDVQTRQRLDVNILGSELLGNRVHYVPMTDSALYLSDVSFEGQVVYTEYAMFDGDIIASHVPVLTGLRNNMHVEWSVVSPAHNALFVMLTEYGDSGTSHHIYRHNLTDRTTSKVVSTSGQAVTDIAATSFVVHENSLLTVGGLGDLLRIDIDSSARTVLVTDFQLRRFSYLAYDAALGEQLYVLDSTGVSVVSLEDGSSTRIDEQGVDVQIVFENISSVVLNPTTSHMLVGLRNQEFIAQLDLTTGERGVFLQNGVGDGIKMLTPRGFTQTEDQQTLFLLDDRSGVSPLLPALVGVDLSTGDRTALGFIDLDNELVRALLHDAATDRLLIQTDRRLLAFTLEELALQVISSSEVGEGEPIGHASSAVIDIQNNRVLVVDDQAHSLVAVDLETGNRTTLSSPELGGGPQFPPTDETVPGTWAMSLDNTGNRVFVGGPIEGILLTVDLSSGNREEIGENCNVLDVSGSDYHADSNTLLVTGRVLSELDLTTGQCKEHRKPRSLFDVLRTNDKQVLATGFHSVYQLDLDSEDFVTISR